MSDTLARVKKVTSDILKIDEDKIGDASQFASELGASSLQSIELIAAFEEEFDVDMDEDDALSMKSVDQAVTYIDKLLAEEE